MEVGELATIAAMNTPHRFEPVPALELADGTALHESSRTNMSRNTAPCGRSELTIGTSRLAMTVVGGAVQVRFTEHKTDAMRLPVARSRRVGTRRWPTD